MIESYAPGAEIDTCPWRAFTDPVVRDVLDLYSAAITDREGSVHLASVRQLNPPNHVWEGVQLYRRLMNKNIDDIREIQAREAKVKR